MYIKLCKYHCRAFRQGGFSVCHASVTWAFVELLCVVVSFTYVYSMPLLVYM